MSIAADIACNNPRSFDVCAAIISQLLAEIAEQDRVEIINKLIGKVRRLPNVGHMEVWLQRISYPYNKGLRFDESLCEIVRGKRESIWCSEWCPEPLRTAIDPSLIVDQQKLNEMEAVVGLNEISLFPAY